MLRAQLSFEQSVGSLLLRTVKPTSKCTNTKTVHLRYNSHEDRNTEGKIN